MYGCGGWNFPRRYIYAPGQILSLTHSGKECYYNYSGFMVAPQNLGDLPGLDGRTFDDAWRLNYIYGRKQ